MTVFFDHWRDDEIVTLRRMFDAGCEDNDIADRLGRTVKAVATRRSMLGITRKRERGDLRPSRRARPWSDKEVSVLRSACAMGWSDVHIGQLLGRSWNSIKGKREILRNQPDVAAVSFNEGERQSFPRALDVERERGEAILTRVLGGHKGPDLRPCDSYRPAHVANHHQPEGSSTAWCSR